MDNWLRNNNIIRIVAVVVGVLLWVIVRLDVQNASGPTQPTTVSQTYTNQTVQVVGLDEERFTLLSYEPTKVSLTVIGTAAALRRVEIDDYRIMLDLTDVQAGEHLVSLTHEGFPSNVQVVLDPPNVSVTLDEKERKEVPVTINIIGSPADGFTAGEPIARPNRVNVTVSSSQADQVASVVGLIDIDGAKEPVLQQVKLVALDQDGNELDVAVSPSVVDVEVPITSPFKTVPLQISLEGETPPGYAVGAFEQSASEVTVFAPQAFLNSLEFYDGLTIDLSKLTASRTYDFEVPLRNGVERIEPGTVTAKVTIVPAVAALLPAVPLTLNGTQDEYQYLLSAPASKSVDVKVEAAQDVIDNLAAKDVRAIVDVSNLPPGVYEVPVEYTLPSFVEPADGNVATVTVEITSKSAETSAEPEAPAAEPTPPAEGDDAAGAAGGSGSGDEAGAGAAAPGQAADAEESEPAA